jgi:hypothetical protein
MPDAGASRKRQIQGRRISGESRVMRQLPFEEIPKNGPGPVISHFGMGSAVSRRAWRCRFHLIDARATRIVGSRRRIQ